MGEASVPVGILCNELLGNSISNPHQHLLKTEQKMGNESTVPKFNDIVVKEKGDGFDYRIHALDLKETKQISLWHDVKLFPSNESRNMNIVNMICEIPRCSRKKYEIATNEPGNPIKQDVKKGYHHHHPQCHRCHHHHRCHR